MAIPRWAAFPAARALPRTHVGRWRPHCPRGLRVGDTVTKTSTITDVQHKAGRTGELWFVTVDHVPTVDGETALTERHDIVYRAMPEPGAPSRRARALSPIPHGTVRPAPCRPIRSVLFRFSALTFNGHRIHYDLDYVREVEGYPGLIVHGPPQAMLMLELLRHARPEARAARFGFRGVAPLFHQDTVSVAGRTTRSAMAGSSCGPATMPAAGHAGLGRGGALTPGGQSGFTAQMYRMAPCAPSLLSNWKALPDELPRMQNDTVSGRRQWPS